jgi:hypothetical protein
MFNWLALCVELGMLAFSPNESEEETSNEGIRRRTAWLARSMEKWKKVAMMENETN